MPTSTLSRSLVYFALLQVNTIESAVFSSSFRLEWTKGSPNVYLCSLVTRDAGRPVCFGEKGGAAVSLRALEFAGTYSNEDPFIDYETHCYDLGLSRENL